MLWNPYTKKTKKTVFPNKKEAKLVSRECLLPIVIKNYRREEKILKDSEGWLRESIVKRKEEER